MSTFSEYSPISGRLLHKKQNEEEELTTGVLYFCPTHSLEVLVQRKYKNNKAGSANHSPH
jgi:hypothetical protein